MAFLCSIQCDKKHVLPSLLNFIIMQQLKRDQKDMIISYDFISLSHISNSKTPDLLFLTTCLHLDE